VTQYQEQLLQNDSQLRHHTVVLSAIESDSNRDAAFGFWKWSSDCGLLLLQTMLDTVKSERNVYKKTLMEQKAEIQVSLVA
jgi:hypothetical protein